MEKDDFNIFLSPHILKSQKKREELKIENINNMMEINSMAIIASAGNAKNYALEALTAIKAGNEDMYNKKIELANDEIRTAHRKHAELLRQLSSEGNLDVINLLVVHAEDHLASVDVLVLIIKEFSELFRERVENG